MKKSVNQIIKKAIENALKLNANSTTSINMFQQKPPKGFENYKK